MVKADIIIVGLHIAKSLVHGSPAIPLFRVSLFVGYLTLGLWRMLFFL